MKGEYLLFNLLVVAGPLVLSFWGPTYFVHRFRAAALALLLAAPPFILWDALVADRHWFFNSQYTLDLRLAGLPPGEIAFFLTVPFACLYSWEMLLKPERGRTIDGLRLLYPPLLLAAPAGLYLVSNGLEYTGLTLLSLALVGLIDLVSGVRVLTHSRFLPFIALVAAFTLAFNGYLTARPLITYDAAYQLDFRITTIPVEDFGFGIALTYLSTVIFERTKTREQGLMARLIRARFGGSYRIPLHEPDRSLPRTLAARDGQAPDAPPRVAVIGGGLAGLCAATHLSERGFEVELFEAKAHLGGKLGAWPETLPDGTVQHVEHGFHAFFKHYYNLNRFLDRLGLRQGWVTEDDYRILTLDRGEFSFKGLAKPPVLNLVSLLRTRMLKLRELVTNPELNRMRAMLEYDPERTFETFDEVSFEQFARDAKLPPNLRLVFNSFARAFFASPESMSMAELVKSFHFYFLSHDLGLDYEMPPEHHHDAVLEPLRRHLEAHAVQLHLDHPVAAIEPGDARRYRLDGRDFDYVVLATDVVGTRAILEASAALTERHPALWAAVRDLRPSQRYSVLRLWLDRDTDRDMRPFMVTDRRRALDSITSVHRLESEARAWAEAGRTSGQGRKRAILELHSYALPEDLRSPDEVREALLEDFHAFVPELKDAEIWHEHMQLERNFTAFHTGQHATRPGHRTDAEGLYFAGDWVHLPCPAMLMEAAITAGTLCVNEILALEALQTEALFTVPHRGLLADGDAKAAPEPRLAG